ncbi:unnamed protein product [Closterium sp. NIES-53]
MPILEPRESTVQIVLVGAGHGSTDEIEGVADESPPFSLHPALPPLQILHPLLLRLPLLLPRLPRLLLLLPFLLLCAVPFAPLRIWLWP